MSQSQSTTINHKVLTTDHIKHIEHLKQLKELQDSHSLQQTYKRLNILPPSLNGGLYTGEPFREGAQYANIPIIPDGGYMTHFAIRSANPPTQALYQYNDNYRPGNNTPVMPGLEQYKGGQYGIVCNNVVSQKMHEKTCNCTKCGCTKYYHL